MSDPIVVTGAGGFIGRALVAHFASTGREHRALVRHHDDSRPPKPGVHVVDDLATVPDAELHVILGGARAIVHLAGRAHVLDETSPDPAAAFASANVTATARLAHAAVLAGIERFVFASTVKVNGDASPRGRAFRENDPAAPADDYARSKYDAERALGQVAATGALQPVILRLPLVYGPGVKGNFRVLWDAVARGRLLPLGAIDNRRSLLGLANLVDALIAAVDAPAGTYLVADAHSVSTPGLVQAIADVQGKPANLAFVPLPILRFAGSFAGRRAAVDRLTSSLEVDASAFTAATGWQPRATLAQGLAAIISQ